MPNKTWTKFQKDLKTFYLSKLAIVLTVKSFIQTPMIQVPSSLYDLNSIIDEIR